MSRPALIREELLNEFINEIRDQLPGYLVAFNGASFQIRNDYLGHVVVDKDIEDFNNLLQSSCGNGYRRVGGNEWLAFFRNDSSIQDVLDKYHTEIPFNAGWKTHGELNGASKQKTKTVVAKLIRTVRCIKELVNNTGQLKNTAIDLVENNWALTPNKAHTLESVKAVERKHWLCVSSLPEESPCCPFCECEEFDWLDGDTSIYGGYGTCKKCGAEVGVSHAEYPA